MCSINSLAVCGKEEKDSGLPEKHHLGNQGAKEIEIMGKSAGSLSPALSVKLVVLRLCNLPGSLLPVIMHIKVVIPRACGHPQPDMEMFCPGIEVIFLWVRSGLGQAAQPFHGS